MVDRASSLRPAQQLQKRGITASRTREGLYEIKIDDRIVTVSLENVRRNYERDHNAASVIEFVDQLTTDYFAESPSWEEVRPFVRYCLEPCDYESGFEGVIRDRVTDELCKVYVFTPSDGSRITWISESMLAEWKVTQADIIGQAEVNMSAIVAETRVECEDIAGVRLGMLSTVETPFKASLVLSPTFRQLVSPTHGWPVYVVVPCRDFAYVVSARDRDFLGRLGRVVVKEYRTSGHPITKDVLEVGDKGITSIGTFPD